jgi:serine/threonine protein kinase/WD40 repeat protein
MTQARPNSGLPPGPLDADELLYQFDRAWQGGSAPSIRDYLPLLARDNERGARQFLEDLIKIDLEYRWRQSGADGQGTRPRLEDYARQLPECLQFEHLSEDLIGGEYLVRHLWGDKPSHAEYARRFTRHGAALHKTLLRIDGELRSEFRTEGRVSPSEAASSRPARLIAPVQPITTPILVDTLRSLALLSAAQLGELNGPASSRFAEPRLLGQELLQRGWLTPYQVNQLLQGHGQELVLASYVLLERLGQGGIGQVFKARHQKLDRVVAVKVIRRELLADADVVARFYREIQVVSHLDHPNVVHAYDAGPVPPADGSRAAATTHFLAMEYVEGTDLARLVKQGGPLPVAQACEYIRQSALGLQHAHERGLVHRDVKPHNLIMSRREGLIKVADLGLARLPRALSDAATAALTSVGATTGTLTPANAVLIGTADYLAPEQALNFHAADIRADIYGLGCTFFYLLTGQPPFPGSTLTEKLLKHQQAPPPELREFRSDVPPGVAAVLTRMLAKQTEQRYQTPAEVAQALATFSHELPATPRSTVSDAPKKRSRFLMAAGALLVAIGLLLFFLFRSGPSTVRPTAPDKEAAAALALQKLRSRAANAGATDDLRRDILDFRMRYPGSPEAAQAAAFLAQLPSPLDRLDKQKIPERLRAAWQPRELVAVLGEPVTPREKKYYVAVSPDGRWLAGGGFAQVVHLWDAATGQEPFTFKGHREMVTAVAFAPDSQTLASASSDERTTVKLWDLKSRAESFTLQADKGHWVTRLAYSADGRRLALGAIGNVRLWDPARHLDVAVLPQNARGLAFNSDGQTLAVADEHTVQFWDAATGKSRARKLSLGNESARAPAWAADGPALAVATTGGLQVWSDPLNDDKPRYQVGSYCEVVGFAPDGKALAWSNGGSLRLVEAVSGKALRQWEFAPHAAITDLAWACDCRHLAVALDDGTVYILRLT